MPIENERRFLVLEMDNHVLENAQKQHIDQRYFDIAFPSFTDVRTRVIDGKKAILGIKMGVGVSRKEFEIETNLKTVDFLSQAQPYFLSKMRYIPKDQPEGEFWIIDVFEGPLNHTITAEVELKNPQQKFFWPKWLHRALEITDSISNLHLARLAADLSKSDESKTPIVIYDAIIKSLVPRIIITGGPCSGKSSIMRVIAQEKKNTFHCVPEIATIMIHQVGINPSGKRLQNIRFHRSLYRIQKIFEATSSEEVAAEGKRALIMDRGAIDNAAYLKGGLKEFENLHHTDKESEYSRYDLVIFLEMPSKDIYEKYKENNPIRRENYKQALALSEKTKKVWSHHPNFQIIPATEKWEEKLKATEEMLDNFLQQKNH